MNETILKWALDVVIPGIVGWLAGRFSFWRADQKKKKELEMFIRGMPNDAKFIIRRFKNTHTLELDVSDKGVMYLVNLGVLTKLDEIPHLDFRWATFMLRMDIYAAINST